jgi:hypothetical protein
LRDRRLLASLPGRAHRLRLEVKPGRGANGLCVYGKPTRRGADPGDPEALELMFWRAPRRLAGRCLRTACDH